MVETTDWKLKTKIDCPDCGGDGIIGGDAEWEKCRGECNGTGKVIEQVEPKEIQRFVSRPESLSFTCVCNRTEIILRPRLNQLPNGWVNWSGDLLCGTCRTLVIYDALIAAADKVRKIKEKFSGIKKLHSNLD